MKQANGWGNDLKDRNAFCLLAAVLRRAPAREDGPGGRLCCSGPARKAVYLISRSVPCSSLLIREALLSP